MSRILKNEPFDAPVERFGSDVWHVAGERCSNSAVKFWSSLVDEALLDYSCATSFVVSASGEICYTRALLFPEMALSEYQLRTHSGESGSVLREALNEISVFGLPAPVSVSLFAGDGSLMECTFPLDCLDSETVPFLVVWLFEWSGVPDRDWNESSVSGAFKAFDRIRRFCYSLDWVFRRTDISEGLYRFELHIGFCRGK